VKRELDLKIVELENMRSDLLSSRRQWEASTEMVQKLTMENNQMADELDIARDKAIKLAKAEASIEKYQQKLEEMTALKKQNKELSSKLDQYLDQINQLESSNKSMATLQRLVEQYKDKAVELEREKFEAVSAAEMKDHEVDRLKTEISNLAESRNALEVTSSPALCFP
jgi:DNA repair exonuclease SbcCD ATPase subunit